MTHFYRLTPADIDAMTPREIDAYLSWRVDYITRQNAEIEKG